MSNLELYIDVVNNQTRTKIGKKKGSDKVVFHNQSNSILQIDFVPTNVVKDKNGHSFIAGITVPANGEESVRFDDAVGTTVKYTATVGTSDPEDPIIIID